MYVNTFSYITTNKNNTALYTGMTSDIVKRIHQYKTKHYYCHLEHYRDSKYILK
ncbi:GIY-YIG nuclease family protein [Galbibacter sp. EGI 63066]|uniref:GIY-YIG nuclease family protein n=1 Tax=Galbibacter sp. EGI 63066 TaxID=2993559 RepID=UPI002B244995|nr:GIY-YIG nuclease family protein [Galbibacter sp. EGI 63066]